MRPANRFLPSLAALAAFCLGLPPAAAQTKPPESASKVKQVLLYNKIGGWIGATDTGAVTAVFTRLAASKGFRLVRLDEDAGITLDYLKQFQVIVWNNNSSGVYSVPDPVARQAILDYLEQGGGWVLLHNAADHNFSWPELTEVLGTTFHLTGKNGRAEVVLDGDGRSHRELRWMLEGFPEVFELEDRWLNFRNTVRPLPGVTVVATTRALPGGSGVLVPTADGSGDQVYLWAREVGRGRLFYNAIGFGNYGLMGQRDSIVPRLYWENLRYAAGDFQNGCTTPERPGFDPGARVHHESLCSATGLRDARPARPGAAAPKGVLRIRPAPPGGPARAGLRDLRGALVPGSGP